MPPIPIATSRFNNETWTENGKYRRQIERHLNQQEEQHTNICIYGAPLQITPKIPINSLMFIIEMNNSTNRIEGIGLIRNLPQFDKYYKVYQEGNYNRYIYKGSHYCPREQLERYNYNLVAVLDYILFKEKTHLKRGSGLTLFPDKLLNHKKCLDMNVNLHQDIQHIFQSIFQFTSTTDK
jgi:hypothetical protein